MAGYKGKELAKVTATDRRAITQEAWQDQTEYKDKHGKHIESITATKEVMIDKDGKQLVRMTTHLTRAVLSDTGPNGPNESKTASSRKTKTGSSQPDKKAKEEKAKPPEKEKENAREKVKKAKKVGPSDDGQTAQSLTVTGDDKSAKSQTMKEFIRDVVKCHNKYRELHGKVGDLKYSKDMSILAQSWAERMALTGAWGKSRNMYNGQEVGENVTFRSTKQGADYLGSEVTDHWYKELKKHDFKGDYQKDSHHFSQVVWRDSREVGIGKSVSPDGKIYVVCNYFPPGNIQNKFKDNVFPAKS